MTDIYIGHEKIKESELQNFLIKKGHINELLKEVIYTKEIDVIELKDEISSKLLIDFKNQVNIKDNSEFEKWLQENNLTKNILMEMLGRPSKIIIFRNEKWGDRAKSMYLRHKKRYEKVTYQLLECNDHDTMREVYFRIKDKEESWESMSEQFYKDVPNKTSLNGPLKITSVDTRILETMKHYGIKNITEPIKLDNSYAVAELVHIDNAGYNEELRETILNDAFENWYFEELKKLKSKTLITN